MSRGHLRAIPHQETDPKDGAAEDEAPAFNAEFGVAAFVHCIGDTGISHGTAVTEIAWRGRQHRDQILFFVPFRGEIEVVAGSSRELLHRGKLAVGAGASLLRLSWRAGAEMAVIGIDRRRFDGFGGELLGEPRRYVQRDHLLQLDDLENELRQLTHLAIDRAVASTAHGPIADALERLLILAFVAAIERQSGGIAWRKPDTLVPRHVSVAADYVRGHCGRDFSWSRAVALSGVSERTLRRAFGEYLGTTPMRLLAEARLDRIRELLRNRQEARSLQELAEAFGFQSYATFWRAYCARFDEKPSDTRLATARGPAPESAA